MTKRQPCTPNFLSSLSKKFICMNQLILRTFRGFFFTSLRTPQRKFTSLDSQNKIIKKLKSNENQISIMILPRVSTPFLEKNNKTQNQNAKQISIIISRASSPAFGRIYPFLFLLPIPPLHLRFLSPLFL